MRPCSASLDGAYHSSSCFSSTVSTKTGKVLVYEVACNNCSTCSRYQDKEGTLSERDPQIWDTTEKLVQQNISNTQIFILNLLYRFPYIGL